VLALILIWSWAKLERMLILIRSCAGVESDDGLCAGSAACQLLEQQKGNTGAPLVA
jgi:hypothetical protein